MAAEVLQAKSDIKTSRVEMRDMGIDCVSPLFLRIASKVGLAKRLNVGDYRKSWDVLKTVKFIQAHVPSDAPVLDIGAYASEVPCSLCRLGYTNINAVDMNRDLTRMPYGDRISYTISDFMHMPFPDSYFSAVTAISVIEHGFQRDRLLTELSRVLKPGGFFIASVDYWPQKIDTRGIRAFGMDWCIFSEDELLSFFYRAGDFGLSPVGEIKLSASEPTIEWQGKRYTFLWFAIGKKA